MPTLVTCLSIIGSSSNINIVTSLQDENGFSFHDENGNSFIDE